MVELRTLNVVLVSVYYVLNTHRKCVHALSRPYLLYTSNAFL